MNHAILITIFLLSIGFCVSTLNTTISKYTKTSVLIEYTTTLGEIIERVEVRDYRSHEPLKTLRGFAKKNTTISSSSSSQPFHENSKVNILKYKGEDKNAHYILVLLNDNFDWKSTKQLDVCFGYTLKDEQDKTSTVEKCLTFKVDQSINDHNMKYVSPSNGHVMMFFICGTLAVVVAMVLVIAAICYKKRELKTQKSLKDGSSILDKEMQFAS